MHRLLFVLALGACSFRLPSGSESQGGAPDGPGANDGGPGFTCHNTTETPTLCVDFEQDALTPSLPDQAPGHINTIATKDVTRMDRDSEHAAQLDDMSKLVIAENASLDISGSLTIEMWASVDPLPPDPGPGGMDRYWMFNNNMQYGMEVMHDGTVRCVIGSNTLDSNPSARLPEGDFRHVACVYDQTAGTLTTYVDGSSLDCKPSGPPPIAGHDGSAIGGNIAAGGNVTARFIGGLDNIAIYAEALSPARICALAGHASCNRICAVSIQL